MNSTEEFVFLLRTTPGSFHVGSRQGWISKEDKEARAEPVELQLLPKGFVEKEGRLHPSNTLAYGGQSGTVDWTQVNYSPEDLQLIQKFLAEAEKKKAFCVRSSGRNSRKNEYGWQSSNS